MIIDNFEVLDSLWHNEILEDDKYLNGIDLNDEYVLEELKKVNILSITINRKSTDFFEKEDNKKSGYEQLCLLVDKCPNLTDFYISINSKIKDISGDDLFNNLMKNLNIERISLRNFLLNYDNLIKLIKESKDNLHVSVSKLGDQKKEFSCLFLNNKEKKKLYFFEGLENKEYNKIYNMLRNGNCPFDFYKKYYSYISKEDSFDLVISNISEISWSDLSIIKSDSRIKGIMVKCGYTDSEKPYTIDEYVQIKQVIDNIVAKIKIPSNDDHNREKIIFSQIYKILGENISYDHYAISEEGKLDTKLENDCRNLKNGLLGVERNGRKEFCCVCAGYATILQNVCSMFNIKCDYVSSNSKEVREDGIFQISGPRKYENGTNDPMGHAYNSVVLDGQAYFCDLTWDAKTLKMGGIAKNFLCSYDTFSKSHRIVGFSNNNLEFILQTGEKSYKNELYKLNEEIYNKDLSYEEQINLFGIVAKGQIEEMVNVSYLSGFVGEYLDFVKQCKNSIEIKEYLDMIKTIQSVEEYIKSDEFQKRASWTGLGMTITQKDKNNNEKQEKTITFYDGSSSTVENARNEVENMDGGTWKLR